MYIVDIHIQYDIRLYRCTSLISYIYEHTYCICLRMYMCTCIRLCNCFDHSLMFLLDLFECINVANAPCVVWKKSTYSLESLTGNPSVWLKQKKCYVLSLNREGRIAALAVNGRTTSSCKLVFINSASEAVSVHSVYRNPQRNIWEGL